jgi:hypothetical protein
MAFLGEPLTVDALRSDAYVESLLASAERRAPAVPTDVDLDPDVAATARLLQSTLVRVHPSFRFEERLAGRLADVAAAMRRDAAPTRGVPADALDPGRAGVGSVLAFPGLAFPGHASPFDGSTDGSVEGSLRDLGAVARPVIAWASAGAIAASLVARLPVPATAVRPDSGPTVAGAVAVTSAAISIGAAAVVAWRRGRLRRGIA